MAGTYTLKARTSEGGLRFAIYDCTNFTTADTITVEDMREVFSAIPAIETQDKAIGVAIGTGAGVSTAKLHNVITIASSAATYDGRLLVVGR